MKITLLESCTKTSQGQLIKSGEFGITKGVNAEKEETTDWTPGSPTLSYTYIKPIMMQIISLNFLILSLFISD